MKSASVRTLFLVATLVLAATAFGGDADKTRDSFNRRPASAAATPAADWAKAARDTHLVMGPWGSGADHNGQFQDMSGNPAWNGWTHGDYTQPTETYWHVDTYNVVSGTYSAWCGDLAFPACSAGDPVGGYGTNWNEILEWRGTVANSSLSCTVNVSAVVNHDTETAYDYCYLSFVKYDQPLVNAWVADGVGVGVHVNTQTIYTPADYLGQGGDEVVVQFRFVSDGGASDQDCGWQGAGAMQLDDVVIALSNGSGYSHDFEDGTLGQFQPVLPDGVGDFTRLWTGLQDLDPCAGNNSVQAAFIDDGIVVPGTGGSPCINWCYGPNGFIINVTGGLAGPDGHLHNFIESPIMAWPEGDYDGAALWYDVYRHEDLSADSPGVAFLWGVRSTASDDPADILGMPWRDRNFLEIGGPDYLRFLDECTDLLEPGRKWVQIQLSVWEIGWAFGYEGNDATPAPYFDNVRLAAYPFSGPGMATREIDLANDGFPAIGEVSTMFLGDNSVRFDMARNISLPLHQRNDPGDSITVDIVPVRSGAALTGAPRLYYRLRTNPLFDPYRTAGLPAVGYVEGVPAANGGTVQPGRWAFDLPDTGFLFPGDVLHYYVQATDEVGGLAQTSTLPADTTGFSDFDDLLVYDPGYVVRGLPTLTERVGEPGTYETPGMLFWNDFGNRGGRNDWYTSFRNLGLVAGRDFDVYYTNGPSSGVGNGLGGRATQFHLDWYDDMLYTSGDLSAFTLANGDYSKDPGQDAQLLAQWLLPGGRDIYLSGDDLATDLAQSGSVTGAFLENQMGLSLVSSDLRPLIGGQVAPVVLAEGGNPVFATTTSWLAYGGCVVINVFDAVQPVGGAIRLAQFASPSGVGNAYGYSAATLNIIPSGSRVVSMPYDFNFIWHDADAPSVATGRVNVLREILAYFGVSGDPGDISGVPEARPFAVRNFPNPFNPATSIEYSLPRRGHLSLKVFNVRGELVRTLVDEVRDQGTGTATWDGTNDLGRQVPSGVYFYEARTGGQVKVHKMALVK
ncbi:MAG: T9SS type A sorting domain-containing protein [Krumholzibacteria bacterium]|nr:T9SS type A sorting domain-containing protein [Candidatus Krumholzibacteria bacterium]